MKWTAGPVTLYRGDARDVLSGLPRRHFASIVTDPPYGERKAGPGDSDADEAAELLRDVLRLCVPLLRPGSHAAVFWSNRTLDRCLESIRSAGLEFKRVLPMYLPQGAARPYRGWLPRTQLVVLAKVPGRFVPPWRDAPAAMLDEAIERSGISAVDLAERLGVNRRMVYRWKAPDCPNWSYPDAVQRAKLREILGVELPAPPAEPKCRHDLYRVQPGRLRHHPCEKPLAVVRDIVERLGGPVLDPFCGSATTLVAAKALGIQATGIEIDPEHCGRAIGRLS